MQGCETDQTDLPAAAATAATAAVPTTTAASAATAATTTTAEAAAATTTAAATLAGACLVDSDVATIDRLAVQALDRSACLIIVGELDKAEAARASGVTIHDEGGGCDLAEGLERFAELGFSCAEREIADVKLHALNPALESEKPVLELGQEKASAILRSGPPGPIRERDRENASPERLWWPSGAPRGGEDGGVVGAGFRHPIAWHSVDSEPGPRRPGEYRGV